MRSFLRAKKREFASSDGPPPPVDLGAEPLQGRRVRPEVPRSLAQLVSSMRERSLFVLALQPQAAATGTAAASAAAPRPAPLAPSGSFGGAGYALKRSTSGGGSGLLLASGHSTSSTGSDRDRDAVSMMHQKWASLLPAATLQPLLSRYVSSSAAEDAEAAAGSGAIPLPPAQQRWGLARQRSLQRAISEAPDDLLAAPAPAAGDDELQDEYTALAEEELAEGAGAVELGERRDGGGREGRCCPSSRCHTTRPHPCHRQAPTSSLPARSRPLLSSRLAPRRRCCSASYSGVSRAPLRARTACLRCTLLSAPAATRGSRS